MMPLARGLGRCGYKGYPFVIGLGLEMIRDMERALITESFVT